jgi:alpha-N-arabinofuranosidase
MKRRRFLKNSALASSGLLMSPDSLLCQSKAFAQPTADSQIEILTNEPIGTIAPEVYGHFSEHIGGVVYDGIWVGPDSKIPNVGGIRKELIEHMRRLQPGSLRWPGGCFADSYNWRDGIGPMDQRPRRANFWLDTPFMKKAPDGPSKYEPNHFGTDEFLRFCELIGAKPYIGANARTLTAQDFKDWVEYCNSPLGTTSFGEMRVANGHRAPYNVAYWGVGNESWGCGGDMLPEDYAAIFRRFTSFVPDFGVGLKLAAVGPSDSWNNRDLAWTERLFSRLAEKANSWTNIPDRVAGYSLHFYCGTTGQSSVDFTEEDWYELLWRSDRMETIITEHWEVLGRFDPDHRIKLYVDEWGAWHPQKTHVHDTHLFGQTSTMRDALIAALTLDTFNRHADKVAVGNIAQLINNLQSLFLAHEDRFVVTPNFHVFEMYRKHQHGQSLRTVFSAPATGSQRGLWGLAGSASRKNNRVLLTVVNPSIDSARETEIRIRGAKAKEAAVTTFAQADFRAHNDLDHPRAVKPPSTSAAKVRQGVITHTFESASVTGISIELG